MLFPVSPETIHGDAASGHGTGPQARAARNSKSGAHRSELEDDDNDNDVNDAMSVATSATMGGKFREIVQDLPFDASGKPCFCKGCGSQASDEIAWTQYYPVYDGSDIVAKTPKGRVCKLCTTTFSCTGLDASYRSIGEFLKFGSSPSGRAALQDFLKKRKALQKEGLESVTKKAKQVSREVGTTELSLQKLQGRKMKNPKRIFVSLQSWDPAIDGVLDQAKVTKELMNGKEVEWCWVLKGREGVWEEETYTDDRMLEDRLEANDTGAFGQEQMENNKKSSFQNFCG